MPGSFLDLEVAAQEYLDACVAALDGTPGGQPECFYLSPGPPPWDSPDCVVVHVGGVALADTYPLVPSLAPGHRIVSAGEVNYPQFTATVLRCAPVLPDDGASLSAADFNAASHIMYADLWAIWNYVKNAKAAGTLFGPSQRDMQIDPAVAVNQSGGVCGWQIPVRVNVYGY